MNSAQPLQVVSKSRTLRVTWLLIFALVLFPVFTLWVVPQLRGKAHLFAALTEPGTTGWIIAFVVGSMCCVVLLVGLLLAFQNRKIAFPSRIWTALAVTGTIVLWGYWFHATTAKSVSSAVAEPSGHSVRLTWKASDSRVAGYNVYRSTSPDNFADPKMNSELIRDTSYTDTTVEHNRTYYYQAKAVDAQGYESSPSNVARAVIP